jgi:hypothetical protein
MGLNQQIIQKEHGLTSWNSQLWNVCKCLHTAGCVCGNVSCSCGGHRSVPPNSRQLWICMNVWCTEFIYTACYVCWSVNNTKPSDLRVSTTEACRLYWGKWKGSPQTGSVWVKPSESEEGASEATGKGELQWAELTWADLSWPEQSRPELWANLRWASLSWAGLRWYGWVETRQGEMSWNCLIKLSWAELSWAKPSW